tara:strand:- start:191 stop:562 length:372 start_codon:yes stop_codon:yes gene_type:complete
MELNLKELYEKGKGYIDYNDTDSVENFYKYKKQDISQLDNVEILFKQLFLYACRNGTSEILALLFQLYFTILDEIQQIALRQMFHYGKYIIIKRKNSEELTEWYDSCVLESMRNTKKSQVTTS